MDRDIELRHLRYFVAVAEELHFGRAAERLHLAQPPLSQQIRKLEELLGYPLFIRTSRSVSLTTAGEALLQRARRTLRNVQRDIDETRSIGRGDVGSLHIGFIGSAMLTTLPGIFRAYREAYPQVQLHLHESFTSLVTEGLENGTLDAGILRALWLSYDEILARRSMHRTPLVLRCIDDHRAGIRRPLDHFTEM